MQAIGRDDLGQDPALSDNAGRVRRVQEIDAAALLECLPPDHHRQNQETDERVDQK